MKLKVHLARYYMETLPFNFKVYFNFAFNTTYHKLYSKCKNNFPKLET